jgi:hypothetical protein
MQAAATRTGLFVLVIAALLAAPARSAREVIPTDSTQITVAYHGTFDLTNTIVPQGVQHTFTYHVEWDFSWSGTWGELFSGGPISNQTSYAKSAITGTLHSLWRATPAGPDLKCTLRIVPQMGDFPDFSARYYASTGSVKISGLEAPTSRFGKYSSTKNPMCGGGPEIDMFSPPPSWSPLGPRTATVSLASGGGIHHYDKSWTWHHIFNSDFRRYYTSAMHTSVEVSVASA